MIKYYVKQTSLSTPEHRRPKIRLTKALTAPHVLKERGIM